MQYTSLSRSMRNDIGRHCTNTSHSTPVAYHVRPLYSHVLSHAQQRFNGTPVLPYYLINGTLTDWRMAWLMIVLDEKGILLERRGMEI